MYNILEFSCSQCEYTTNTSSKKFKNYINIEHNDIDYTHVTSVNFLLHYKVV